MKRIIIYVLIILSSSCYYDAADLLYPASTVCDTTATSYSQKVVPLLQQHCYSCHLNASTGGGIMMGNYTADKALVTNGKLYGSISHTTGYSAMPKGAAKMTNCQIAIIKQWIDAGTPAN